MSTSWSGYKAVVDGVGGRRRREDDMVEVCKAKREESDARLCPILLPPILLTRSHRSPSVLTPALRTIGNIVTGNDTQTQHIIDLQALPCLLNLLRGPYSKTIRKEACWTLSNITAGCQSQIQAVFDANICPALVLICSKPLSSMSRMKLLGLSATL